MSEISNQNHSLSLAHRMSIRGFKKSFKKSNQFISEKIGLAKGTELDQKYTALEKKIDSIVKMVDESRTLTHEFLQPNPMIRTKMTTINNWSKIRGEGKVSIYPQPEKALGDSLVKYSADLGEKSSFGHALYDLGESMRQVATEKELLENNIKQNFIDPLTYLKHHDLNTIMHQRKVSESLRLAYDSQRNVKKMTPNIENNIRVAAENFENSKIVTEAEMIKFLQNERDQILLLQNFAEGLVEYHQKCTDILKITLQDLNERQKSLVAGKKDFLSAKTRQIKHQIADLVRPENSRESAEL